MSRWRSLRQHDWQIIHLFLRRFNTNIAMRAHRTPTIPPNIMAVDNLNLLEASRLIGGINATAAVPATMPLVRHNLAPM